MKAIEMYRFPDHWELHPLPDVLFLQEGPGIRKKEYQDDGYPMINVRCVQDGYIDMSKARAANMELATTKWSHFQIDENDILFTISGTIGRSAIVKKSDLPLLMNTSVVRFKPIHPDLNLNFAYQYLSSNFFVEMLKNMSTGTAIQNVGPSHLKKLYVPVPPLPEQHRIVSIIEQASAAIELAKDNAEKNVQNAKQLFESYLRKTFDELVLKHSLTTLGDSCEFFNGKAHEKEIDISGDYVVVNSKFISSEGETIKKTANQMFPLVTNDIVMVMSDVPNGKALAKCAIIDEDNIYSLNQRICCIRSENYDTKYLYYQLNRHPYLLSFNNGENQTNLRKGDILNTPLTLPNIEVQKAVASKLDEVRNQAKQLEINYQNKLDDLEELKRSIIERAFKGELLIDTELQTT